MIAVTGASGLLGQHLVERLVAEGMQVLAIVRKSGTTFPEGVQVREADVLDFLGLTKAMEGVQTVVHAAGCVSYNPRRRDEIYAVNVEGTRNMVNVCLKEGIGTFVHISSVAALGRRPGVAISESDPWTGAYSSDYARSKYLAELESFRGNEEGLRVSVVNPSVILSGNPLHRSSGSLLDYVWKESPFYTSGSMNYVDVRDVGEAVVRLIRSPKPGERFTLNAGSVAYLDFFSRLAHRWKKKPPYVRIPSGLVRVFGLAGEFRAWLTGQEPVVTRQSAAMTATHFRYDTRKVQQLGLQFRDLDDTLDWCATEYAQYVAPNK